MQRALRPISILVDCLHSVVALVDNLVARYKPMLPVHLPLLPGHIPALPVQILNATDFSALAEAFECGDAARFNLLWRRMMGLKNRWLLRMRPGHCVPFDMVACASADFGRCWAFLGSCWPYESLIAANESVSKMPVQILNATDFYALAEAFECGDAARFNLLWR